MFVAKPQIQHQHTQKVICACLLTQDRLDGRRHTHTTLKLPTMSSPKKTAMAAQIKDSRREKEEEDGFLWWFAF